MRYINKITSILHGVYPNYRNSLKIMENSIIIFKSFIPFA